MRGLSLLGILLLLAGLATAQANEPSPGGAASVAPGEPSRPAAPLAPAPAPPAPAGLPDTPAHGSPASKAPAPAPVIVRLPAPAGSSAWTASLSAIEALLHQQQRQLQTLDDRLAACDANTLEAAAALGTRLEALERAVRMLHAQQAAPAHLEAIAQGIEALGARLAALETAVNALEARDAARRRTAEPRDEGRAAAADTDGDPLQRPAVTSLPPRQGPTSPGERLYVVRPGDTLLDVAVRFAVPLPRLIELNGLEDPDRVLAGQRLRIPATAHPATAP